jgi:hypothetical protein
MSSAVPSLAVASGVVMPRVFINYQGSDEPWLAQWLSREFVSRLGSEEVFLDSRSIPLGEDYGRMLPRAVRSSAVLLVIIGPGWDVSNPASWVRREIAEAFAAEVRVIPVLVDSIAELSHDKLPADLRRLAELQYVRLRSRDAHRDVPRVVDDIVALVALAA